MNRQQGLNPYAPSELTDPSEPPSRKENGRFPTAGTLAATCGGIIVSGSFFGMLVGGFIALADSANLSGVLLLLALGWVVGGVIATISSVPTVLVALCLASPLVPLAKGWRPLQIRSFAAVCGFFSGSCPVILVDLSNPLAWFASLVPGLFGAVGTALFTRWIFGWTQRAKRKQIDRTLVEDSTDNVP